MKTLKKAVAILLSVACLASLLSVFSCATDAQEPEESPEPSVMLGYDYNHDVWLMVKAYGVYESHYKSIALCRINKNGEREVIEKYTYHEWEFEGEKHWRIKELYSFVDDFFMFPCDKSLFSQGNSYCLYLSDAESFTDDDGEVITIPETVQIDFTYDDLFEGKPRFHGSYLQLEEESSVDMREYILFPVDKDAGFNSEDKYALKNPDYSDPYNSYTITIWEYSDGNNWQENDHYICIYNKETGEEYSTTLIRVTEKKPDNFKELIAFTFEKLSEGILSSAENIGLSVASSIFGMFLPVIFAVAFIVAPFVNLYLFS